MASILNADTSNGLKLTSDTSGEIELQANGVTKAKVTANGLQDANGNSLRGGMYRNLIINGDMQIAQRGTSAAGITTGDSYRTLDRWRSNLSSAGTWTMSQDTDVPSGQGFSTSMKWDCTTANGSLSASSYMYFNQYFEGQMLQHLKKGTSNAESVTLSFWVKSNKTGTYTVFLLDSDNTRLISKSYTIDTADTWEKKTITYEGDTTGTLNNDNNLSLILRFMLAAGTDYTSGTLQTTWGANVNANRAVGQVNLADSTSNYINITGVQLEVGEGASDFEFLPFDVQLQRCQRYFCKSYNYEDAIGTNTWDGTLAARNFDSVVRTDFPFNACFPVEMRANPTITAYSKSGIAGRRTSGGTSIDGSSSETINISFLGNSKCIRGSTSPSGVNAGTWLQAHYTAQAEL